MMPTGTLFEVIASNTITHHRTTSYYVAASADQARAEFLQATDHEHPVQMVEPARCNHESPLCAGRVTLWTHGIVTAPWCDYHGAKKLD
jgi:hypothetical protein